jgi:hypothetical protein
MRRASASRPRSSSTRPRWKPAAGSRTTMGSSSARAVSVSPARLCASASRTRAARSAVSRATRCSSAGISAADGGCGPAVAHAVAREQRAATVSRGRIRQRANSATATAPAGWCSFIVHMTARHDDMRPRRSAPGSCRGGPAVSADSSNIRPVGVAAMVSIASTARAWTSPSGNQATRRLPSCRYARAPGRRYATCAGVEPARTARSAPQATRQAG